MSKNKYGIRIYTVKERASLALHATAYSASVAGIVCCTSSPVLTMFVLASSMLLSTATLKWNSGDLRLSTPASHWPENSKNFPKAVSLISEILNVHTPPLRIIDEVNETKENKFIKEKERNIERKMGNYANASVEFFNLTECAVNVTKPMLRILNLPEQVAVAAHEMAHIAANHAILSVTYKIAQHALYGVVGTNFALVVLNVASGEYKTATEVISEVEFAYLLILPAVCAKLISTSYQRSNEFQADRIATEVLNSALLVPALRDTNKYNTEKNSEFSSLGYTKGSLISRMFKRANSIWSSHPHNDRRCRRIEKIATRLKKMNSLAAVN